MLLLVLHLAELVVATVSTSAVLPAHTPSHQALVVEQLLTHLR
jgi:hypothetical protein